MKLLKTLGVLLVAGILACQATEEGQTPESPVVIEQVCSDLEEVEHYDAVWTFRFGTSDGGISKRTTIYSVSGNDMYVTHEEVDLDSSGDEPEEDRKWVETIYVDGEVYLRGEGYSDVPSRDWEKQPEDESDNPVAQRNRVLPCFGTGEASPSPGEERYFFVRDWLPQLDAIEETTTEYWIDEKGRSLQTVTKRVVTYPDGDTYSEEKTNEYRIDDKGWPLQIAWKEVTVHLDGNTETFESSVTYSGLGEPNVITKPTPLPPTPEPTLTPKEEIQQACDKLGATDYDRTSISTMSDGSKVVVTKKLSGSDGHTLRMDYDGDTLTFRQETVITSPLAFSRVSYDLDTWSPWMAEEGPTSSGGDSPCRSGFGDNWEKVGPREYVKDEEDGRSKIWIDSEGHLQRRYSYNAEGYLEFEVTFSDIGDSNII